MPSNESHPSDGQGKVQRAGQPVPRPGAVHGLQLVAVRVRSLGLRARPLDHEPELAGAVGGPVRRLQQHGPVHHRPVLVVRPVQVDPSVRPCLAAPARHGGNGAYADSVGTVPYLKDI